MTRSPSIPRPSPTAANNGQGAAIRDRLKGRQMFTDPEDALDLDQPATVAEDLLDRAERKARQATSPYHPRTTPAPPSVEEAVRPQQAEAVPRVEEAFPPWEDPEPAAPRPRRPAAPDRPQAEQKKEARAMRRLLDLAPPAWATHYLHLPTALVTSGLFGLLERRLPGLGTTVVVLFTHADMREGIMRASEATLCREIGIADRRTLRARLDLLRTPLLLEDGLTLPRFLARLRRRTARDTAPYAIPVEALRGLVALVQALEDRQAAAARQTHAKRQSAGQANAAVGWQKRRQGKTGRRDM